MTRALAFLAIVIGASGCSCKLPPYDGVQPVVGRESVEIYRAALEVRLSKLRGSALAPLVVYATGDGGWQGLDQQIFDWLSDSGYMVAGFSSKSYLRNLVAVSDSTTPRQLARDFETVADVATRHFGLPADTRLVLVGLSRGADLVAIAAGQSGFRARLAGLLLLGLTDEEEYLRRPRRRRPPGRTEGTEVSPGPLDPYASLKRVSDIPVVLIQSTNDRYVPAATARTLFGPDTAMRRLVSVDANDHGFRGGCESLYQDLQQWLHWIMSAISVTGYGVPNFRGPS
jgi:fermentation-respiration switch protein FrsA (DUF1100 family)